MMSSVYVYYEQTLIQVKIDNLVSQVLFAAADLHATLEDDIGNNDVICFNLPAGLWLSSRL